MTRGFATYVLLVVSVLPQSVAAEGKQWVHAESYMQVRQNTLGENEWPFLQHLAAGTTLSKTADFDLSLKVMGDPLAEKNDFDLYASRISVRDIGQVASFSLGRQWIGSGFSQNLMDGANLLIRPDSYVNAEAYGGFVRFMELNEFQDWNFATGGRLFLNKVPGTEASLRLRYEMIQDAERWFEIGFTTSKVLPLPSQPRIHGGLNFDVNNEIIEQAFVGFTVFPASMVDITVEGGRYDYKRDHFDPAEDIFTIFALGALWEVRESVALMATDQVTLFQSYAFQKYDYDLIESETGFALDGGVRVAGFANQVDATLTGFVDQSYGGRTYGMKARGEVWFNNMIFGKLRFGVLHFNKITGEAGEASTLSADLGVEVYNGIKVVGGAQLNSNDEFKQDWRGTLAVEIDYF